MSTGAILPSNVDEINARPPVRVRHPSRLRLSLLLIIPLALGLAYLVLGPHPFEQAGHSLAQVGQHALETAARTLAGRSRTPSGLDQNGGISANMPAQVLASVGILAVVGLLLRVLRGH